MSEIRLWVWRNGPGQFVAYDDEYPRYENGDPKTLGEPIGVAVLQPYEKSPVSVAAYNRLKTNGASEMAENIRQNNAILEALRNRDA